MASITIDHLQPTVEFQELSGAELESVVGGLIPPVWLPFLATGLAGTAVSLGAAGLGIGITNMLENRKARAAWSGAMAH